MSRRALQVGLIAILGASFAAAQQKPSVVRTSGFDPQRLARIDTFMQRAVDSNRLAGAVLLVMRDGKVVYERAFGWADREARRPMRTDAMFRIASQTKAITSAALLSLVEEGKAAVTDPVSLYIPSFARTTVATRTDTAVVMVPARRQIRLADLLTHTAGISYGGDRSVVDAYRAAGLGPAAGFGWYTADKDEGVCTTMERLGTLPMVAQPGEAWVYGYGTDILGCVVERAARIPLDEAIRSRVTGPLKMSDTHFFIPIGQRDRLVTVYTSDSTNHAVRAIEGSRGQGHYVEGPRRNFSGGAGLVSTARDYARFLEAIRNGGALDGTRILAPHTVALMTTNQVGNLHGTNGLGFGFGFETVDRYGAKGMSSVGTFLWAGAYGSVYFVDPKERLIGVFMTNMLPSRSDAADKFPTLIYQALTGSVP